MIKSDGEMLKAAPPFFYASAFEPALTTKAQPIVAIGQECIARLLERIQLPEKELTHITLPVELIERSSCQCL